MVVEEVVAVGDVEEDGVGVEEGAGVEVMANGTTTTSETETVLLRLKLQHHKLCSYEQLVG